VRVLHVHSSDTANWQGKLVEFARTTSLREFEYHGSNFNAVVTAEDTGDNADTMRIRLHTTGQECTGELVIEGCWERTEFFDFMRMLALALNEHPRRVEWAKGQDGRLRKEVSPGGGSF